MKNGGNNRTTDFYTLSGKLQLCCSSNVWTLSSTGRAVEINGLIQFRQSSLLVNPRALSEGVAILVRHLLDKSITSGG